MASKCDVCMSVYMCTQVCARMYVNVVLLPFMLLCNDGRGSCFLEQSANRSEVWSVFEYKLVALETVSPLRATLEMKSAFG